MNIDIFGMLFMEQSMHTQIEGLPIINGSVLMISNYDGARGYINWIPPSWLEPSVLIPKIALVALSFAIIVIASIIYSKIKFNDSSKSKDEVKKRYAALYALEVASHIPELDIALVPEAWVAETAVVTH